MRRAHAGDAVEYRGSSQAGVEQLAAIVRGEKGTQEDSRFSGITSHR